MMIISEKAIQKSIDPPSPLGTPHELLLWTFCQEELVRSTTHLFVAVVTGAGLPLWEISALSEPAGRQLLAGDVGVVVGAAVEMYARSIGRLSQPLYGVESVGQKSGESCGGWLGR
jgi:hypothetical protein